MPYVVTRGEVHHDGQVYTPGEQVPAMKGALSDVEAAGAVQWRDSRVETTAKRKATAAKRKAAKR